MTEAKPDFSKVSEENVKNFTREEQVKEKEKWVKIDLKTISQSFHNIT